MNQVQLLKNRFEKLNSHETSVESLDIGTPLRAKSEPPIKFNRAVTCIDFSKLNIKESPRAKEEPPRPFQRQVSSSSTSSYKSIRRSPAFRFDAQTRPSVVKSVAKDVPVKPQAEIDELEYLSTSATIKKALLKPLPTGSPPKKPPRTFLSPEFPKKIDAESTPVQTPLIKPRVSPNTLPKKAEKTEDRKPQIASFLNCIISPCSIDPIYYEQIRNEQRLKRQEESIYAEPFAHLKKDFANNDAESSPKSEELHYMCTVLDPQPADVNGNSSKEEKRRASLESSDLEDYEKVSGSDNVTPSVAGDSRDLSAFVFRSKCCSMSFTTRSSAITSSTRPRTRRASHRKAQRRAGFRDR